MHAGITSRSITLALVAALPCSASAQRADTFFRSSDIAWAGAFAVGSYGLSWLDPKIAKYFQQPAKQGDPTMRRLAEGFTNIQETTLTITGILTYGVARLAKAHTVEEVALHASESIVASSLTSQVIRGPLGRARPKDATPRFEDQYEFHWFNGFRNFEYRAFPSIHSASAFAAATAIVRETHYRSPQSTWLVAPVAYVLASGPGYSRMFLGQHWASDIFMGAFIGTFYGARVVDYARAHPDNRVDRFFLGKRLTPGASIVPIKGGVTISFAAQF